jgi:hypothetical protein
VFGVFEVLGLAAVGTILWLIHVSLREARIVVAREERALALVRRLGAAEEAFKAAARLDHNGDGMPEFGGLEDLVAAGLVDGPVERDEVGPRLDLEGYRVEILLPSGVDPGGRRLLARRPDLADPRVSAHQFAVVAMPIREGPRALRGFYLDAVGQLYVAEGVYDPDREPYAPPPPLELREDKDEGGAAQGPVWRRYEAARTPPR